MARLAESSVVLALRDWQWKNRIAGKQSPEMFVSLEGNAEAVLGDAKLKFGERLYLFEVKSTTDTISEEWTNTKLIKKTNPDSATETSTEERVPNPKKAYQKLVGELQNIQFPGLESLDLLPELTFYKSPEITCPTNILDSIRCHHFLFWEKNDFRIDPYLLKVAEKKGLTNGPYGGEDKMMLHYHQFIRTFYMAERAYPPFAIKIDRIKFKKAEFFHPAHFQERTSVINRHEVSEVERIFWCSTGLRIDAFQRYIDWLCDDENHDIHVVLYSDKGTLFQEIFCTDDLKGIIKKYSEEPEFSEMDLALLEKLEEAEPMSMSSAFRASPSVQP